MATVAVTCIKNGRADQFGRPMVSGTDYPAIEREHARSLWNAGFVSVADASVFDDDPLAGTSPLDDFNVARALSLSRQLEQTVANVEAEIAAAGISAGGGGGGGGTFTASGTATYSGGNVTISLPHAMSGATLILTPTVGEVGVDFSGDGTNWIAVYGGDISTAQTITFDAVITHIRLRPIDTGASSAYSVTATGAHTVQSGSISFGAGNVIVALSNATAGATAYVYPSAGEIGVDYTGDASPSTGSTWIAVSGGNVIADASIVALAVVTGFRFRPIASGAAADYVVRT